MFFAVTPSPYPTDITVTQSTGGSPGFLGFVFTFLLAVAAVLLFLSLTKQLRRVDRRAKQLGLDDDTTADATTPDGAMPDDERPASS